MALIRKTAQPADLQRPSSGYEVAASDPWMLVAEGAPVPDDADAIVPIARLVAEPSLLDRRGRTGARVPNDRGLDAVLPFLPRLALVALEIPKHVDGRAYSLARLLRERHAFAGEVRAVGNVLRDNLLFLHRCGFDAFELDPKYGPGGLDPAAALAAFDELSVRYQAAADVSLPLWKRAAGA